jgi:hypothetical protein
MKDEGHPPPIPAAGALFARIPVSFFRRGFSGGAAIYGFAFFSAFS